MSTPRKHSTSRASVQRHRDRMRARGFRLLQIWIPDTRSPEFAEECRRQSLLLANDPAEHEIMTEIEAMMDTDGWTA
ncbi:MAG: antitoxin MazE family protein [Dokdonella sp.]